MEGCSCHAACKQAAQETDLTGKEQCNPPCQLHLGVRMQWRKSLRLTGPLLGVLGDTGEKVPGLLRLKAQNPSALTAPGMAAKFGLCLASACS